MLHAGSGSGFSFNDYNNDNDNSNVSAHIAFKNLSSTDLAPWQKIDTTYGALVAYRRRRPTKQRLMKRLNNLYDQILSIDNLLLADQRARKNKLRQRGIIKFDKNFDQNIADIYRELVTKTYKTSKYTTRTIYESKERIISILPYRDRIVHHAIMNVLEPMFVSTFTADTYSCIKGKGVHKASLKVEQYLRDVKGTTYCLKIDIRKFYPNVDHTVLKSLLRRKIKDIEVLELLDGIIDSAPGIPIGNYLSQYFANFYLAYFDHWMKEQKRVKYYLRYADDIIVFHYDKEYLRRVLEGMRKYLLERLKLEIKSNFQIFPVKARGADFVGYVHYHNKKRLRKRIKQAFARMIARRNRSRNPERFRPSVESYKGWAKHCNSKNLLKKLNAA